MPAKTKTVDEVLNPSADQLIAEHIALKDHLANETKRFNELMKPYKDRMEAIDNQLMAMLNALGGDDKAMLSCDAGTAYKSNIMSVSVSPEAVPFKNPETGEDEVGREALLDFSLAHWDEIGSELLMFQPQKDAVKRWMDEHDGMPPPGVKVGWFARVNVRRS